MSEMMNTKSFSTVQTIYIFRKKAKNKFSFPLTCLRIMVIYNLNILLIKRIILDETNSLPPPPIKKMTRIEITQQMLKSLKENAYWSKSQNPHDHCYLPAGICICKSFYPRILQSFKIKKKQEAKLYFTSK